MENHQQIFKKFLIDAKVLEKDLPSFIEKAKYHQVKEPKVLINSDQKVDKIFIIVEGDCIYRFFDKAGFLSREHMKIWSPSMTGGYEYVTGSEKYRKEVKLIKGGYYELEIKDLEEACNESLLRLCKTGCKNLMYYISKGIIKQKEHYAKIVNSFTILLSFLCLSLTFFKVKVYFASASITNFMLVTYTIITAFMLIILRKFNRRPFHYYGITLRRWRESIKDGILLSIPVLILATVGKAIATVIPDSPFYGHNVFDFYNKYGNTISIIGVYMIICFLQEFIARGGLLAISRQIFFEADNMKTPWRSIFLSSMFFMLFYIHLPITILILSCILSLYWGWLYVRTNNLIGVTLNHIIVSLFGLYALGINKLVT